MIKLLKDGKVDVESADLVGEIKDAGPNDWLFFVNYHGC
jgi:hypothetical protein